MLIKSRTASRRSLERVLKSKPRAKNQGIGMEFVLDDLAGLPMSDEDIVIILTNLIDNAMNAAKKADLKMIQV
ncbi:MAG: GHKL domain-containing protein, partial [Oscillospiraceae bacterium]|nr:GHKL domain-containing protein [Oscillospiraceae bacterium]